jgi:hypothetical protein
MKTYLITTGTLFGLIVLAHIWRILEEGVHPITELPFVLLTIVSAGMSTWAWILVARSRRS